MQNGYRPNGGIGNRVLPQRADSMTGAGGAYAGTGLWKNGNENPPGAKGQGLVAE